jgi:hypothetical protein
MSVWQWVAITVAAVLLAYVFFLIWLVIAGRKAEARAVGDLSPTPSNSSGACSPIAACLAANGPCEAVCWLAGLEPATS